MKRTTTTPVPVTDHAILQWLARIQLIDVEQLRADLARAAEVGMRFGAGAVIVSGGKLLIDDGTVTEVIRRSDYPSRAVGRLVAAMDAEIVLCHRAQRRRRR